MILSRMPGFLPGFKPYIVAPRLQEYTREFCSMRKLSTFILIALLSLTAERVLAENVRIQTSMGDIVVALDRQHAPVTVENFLKYVNEGFYDGTIFHRVIDGFMIQGGGFTGDYEKKDTHKPIKNEADNGLKNTTGTIAMARTRDPHSASAQFFINVADNSFLNHKAPTVAGWGYAVFGKVIQGMGVVNKIKAVQTGPGGPFRSDAPRTKVFINKITIESTKSKK
jgi:peptidyl-prolyl cis-trans isomerase B (cyclophilin B)